ncbi:MAG: PQQ-binding-like beta-propeller repeat protein [Acidobacteria bacterium]|nr:PQQ-binding-like beta-propeller repeat protein [Acidobacteriota bacterium]
MDKKTEIALLKRRNAPPPVPTPDAPASSAPGASTSAPAPPSSAAGQTPSGWWTYHGDPEHTGFVSDSDINSSNVGTLGTALYSLQLGGPILSVPAVVDGFIYVGVANYHAAQGGNGGALHKIDIQTGQIVKTFAWDLLTDPEDTHSFTGMGMTPAIINGRVYFGAFNGKFYCLDQETLEMQWITDLRNQDLKHNQPISNVAGGRPAAVIWSSPVFNADATELYVGCGEGENPSLYSFVFCLDAATGNVSWIYCTNKFSHDADNQPNMLPQNAVQILPPPTGYTIFPGEPIVMGCSVWGAIAYDKDLNRLYCPTGNQQPEPNANWTWSDPTQPPPPFAPELPSIGYSNGLLALDADTGANMGFWQVLPESNYRPSDGDIDIGSSPTIFTLDGEKMIAIACKNGSVFTLDAGFFQLLKWRQLLPRMQDGTNIPTVDPHPNPASPEINPHMTNELSDAIPNENYSGAFNTAAYYPGSQDNPQTITPRLFVALGGPNYHSASPGIDSDTTPFMRAVDADTLVDVWPLDNGDPQRYLNTQHMDTAQGMQVGMYSNAGESGLSSPAVVNDVVFCTTSKISIYAFDVRDGTLLWMDDMGMQTDGYNGGYGYCLGAAIWKNYVVAGGLIAGLDGGILNIYRLPAPQTPPG